MASAKTITDHDQIRKWAEERGGRPSVVKATEGGKQGGGILRFDFQEKDESLDEISWDEFFKIFEERKLALLEQDETASGKTSRFFKFVARGDDS
jgi:glutathione synthase/RimK-type ligase-like ATP-grasp enzyme